MTTTATRRLQRGVSLVEAIVAMAVMAFGMIGMLGMQATLRGNADLSRQRAEAVRIAQTTLESRRAFSVIESTPGRAAFADIVTQPEAEVTGLADLNTSYFLTETVTNQANPRRKTLVVDVRWRDRADVPQSVQMATELTAVAPSLRGALATSSEGSPAQRTYGRERRIPAVAVDLGNGTSGFRPPQPAGGNVVLVFNNVTGVVFLCQTTAASTALLNSGNISSCGPSPLAFVSGNVRFAYSAIPTAARAENPVDTALNLDLSLLSPPSPASAATCFDDSPTTSAAAASQTNVSYFCVVTPGADATWSGTLVVDPLGLDGAPAWTIAATGSTAFKVCRYTPASTDTAANPDHPRTYLSVTNTEVLTNQNFLVIAASDTCPADGPPDASIGDFVNSNTRQHQPAP